MSSRTTEYLIFGDQSWPVDSLAQALSESEVSVWLDGKGWTQGRAQKLSKTSKNARQAIEDMAEIHSAVATVAIVGIQNAEISQEVVEALRHKKDVKILQMGARSSTVLNQDKRKLAWSDIFHNGVDSEIELLKVQYQVRNLREKLKDAQKVAILLQDDPDPDGLASALALRKLLGRKSQSAPIVSFGKISRPENLAMSRLLDIEVRTIEEAELAGFDQLVLIDCQPSFFRGKNIQPDVVFDHHPQMPEAYKADAIIEIREDVGATASLLTQFLRAAGVEISQRLATALLYGIKTDTLHLNREVSPVDLESFVYLYPLVNGNVLRRIEHPELPLGYLDSLSKALKNIHSAEGVTVLAMPNVDREEWIPQAADFALQVEGSKWGIACGIFEGHVIISGRNCGYIQHCGDIFKELFNGIGCAGGHRSMAKAIIKRERWNQVFGPRSTGPAQIAHILGKLLAKNLPAVAN